MMHPSYGRAGRSWLHMWTMPTSLGGTRQIPQQPYFVWRQSCIGGNSRPVIWSGVKMRWKLWACGSERIRSEKSRPGRGDYTVLWARCFAKAAALGRCG
eukprot:6233250-Karenia_brevis.AAC.1